MKEQACNKIKSNTKTQELKDKEFKDLASGKIVSLKILSRTWKLCPSNPEPGSRSKYHFAQQSPKRTDPFDGASGKIHHKSVKWEYNEKRETFQ
ncbi:hypothetical protein Tco_0911044 [Tanacetum coccineum]|uniref:Uncharacterized protein n=1 Tax=Tanacetum coccineum TaxID=301880 RepID=A0ABQ5CVJ3_9ASTR